MIWVTPRTTPLACWFRRGLSRISSWQCQCHSDKMLLWPTVLGITNSDMVTLWICWRFITVFERWKRTRPSKQCKSLIWILIFVFPVLICYRKRRLWQFWQIFNYAGNFSSCGQYSSITLLQLLIRWSVCWKMLVIQRTVLFANDHLQRNRGARRRPDRPDGHLQQSVLLRPFDFGHLEDSTLCKRPFAKERRRPDHTDGHLQQFLLAFGHPENRTLCKWSFAKERKSREEAKSSGGSFARVIDT